MKKNVYEFSLAICFVFICLFSYSNKVEAHDLWLNLSHHYNDIGSSVDAYLAWGHSYPFSDFLDLSRLDKMYVITPSGKSTYLHPEKENSATKIKINEQGTYLLAASTKAGYHTQTTTGYTSKSKSESKNVIHSTWSEKYAKAIFYGDIPGNKAYQKELGHNIEIVPLKDPGTLTAGGSLPVKALFKGKPLAKTFVYGSYLGFSTTGAFAYTTLTNKNGIADIKIIQPGIWQIMVQYIYPADDSRECDDYKYVTILTFEVR